MSSHRLTKIYFDQRSSEWVSEPKCKVCFFLLLPDFPGEYRTSKILTLNFMRRFWERCSDLTNGDGQWLKCKLRWRCRCRWRNCRPTSLQCCANFIDCQFRDELNLRLRNSYTNRSLQRRQHSTHLPAWSSSSPFIFSQDTRCSTDEH